MSFWPFWWGAASLAGVAVAYLVAIRRPMGVSGVIGIALDRGALRQELSSAAPPSDSDMQAMLLAATRKAFGESLVAEPVPEAATAPTPPRLGRGLSWKESWLFLASIALGGALSAALAGRAATWELDATYRALVGGGPMSFVALFAGGVLVGLGTQMAGGCTSGHGLVGCGGMQPGSLIATAMFFGTAVAASFLLAGLGS